MHDKSATPPKPLIDKKPQVGIFVVVVVIYFLLNI